MQLLPDNIHYAEQLECYRTLYEKDHSFSNIVKHDMAELKGRMSTIENTVKRQKVADFINAIGQLFVA